MIKECYQLQNLASVKKVHYAVFAGRTEWQIGSRGALSLYFKFAKLKKMHKS